MDDPLVSVVLPVRDGAGEVARQLRALASQEAPGPWKGVVVDDGSADRTRGVVAAAGRSLPLPLTLVGGPGRGAAAARNEGARHTRAPALLYLDHDDEVAPGYLRAMVAALRDHRLVAARLDCRALNPGWVGEYRPPMQEHSLSRGLHPFAAGGSLGMRRELFDELGGFREAAGRADDRDLCFRAAARGVELVLVPAAVVRYRYRDRPSSVFAQARAGGVGSARLYALWRGEGMRPRLARVEARHALQAGWAGLTGRSPAARASALHRLGAVVGHLEGSFRTGVPYVRWRLPTDTTGAGPPRLPT